MTTGPAPLIRVDSTMWIYMTGRDRRTWAAR